MTEYPHVPAAFINTIYEEGTKEDAIYCLQQTWNELIFVKAELTDPAQKETKSATPRVSAVQDEIKHCGYSAANDRVLHLAWTMERELTALQQQVDINHLAYEEAQGWVKKWAADCGRLEKELRIRACSKQASGGYVCECCRAHWDAADAAFAEPETP